MCTGHNSPKGSTGTSCQVRHPWWTHSLILWNRSSLHCVQQVGLNTSYAAVSETVISLLSCYFSSCCGSPTLPAVRGAGSVLRTAACSAAQFCKQDQTGFSFPPVFQLAVAFAVAHSSLVASNSTSLWDVGIKCILTCSAPQLCRQAQTGWGWPVWITAWLCLSCLSCLSAST